LVVGGGFGAGVFAIAFGVGRAGVGAAVRPRAGNTADVDVVPREGLGRGRAAAGDGLVCGSELVGRFGDGVEVKVGADGDGATPSANDLGEDVVQVVGERGLVFPGDLELGH